jgi:hypothetical protein
MHWIIVVLWALTRPPKEEVPSRSPVLTQQQIDERLLTEGTCPSCKAENAMRLGPQGGVATNVMCIECRDEFNVIFANGVTLLDRMGKADEARATRIYGWKAVA